MDYYADKKHVYIPCVFLPYHDYTSVCASTCINVRICILTEIHIHNMHKYIIAETFANTDSEFKYIYIVLFETRDRFFGGRLFDKLLTINSSSSICYITDM